MHLITLRDHRGLTIAHCANAQIILDDEMRDIWPHVETVREQLVPGWDAELFLYRITGQPGIELPKDSGVRESLRRSIHNHMHAKGTFFA